LAASDVCVNSGLGLEEKLGPGPANTKRVFITRRDGEVNRRWDIELRLEHKIDYSAMDRPPL